MVWGDSAPHAASAARTGQSLILNVGPVAAGSMFSSRHTLLFFLLLLSLAVIGDAQLSTNASTKPSLRVGDYADGLANGTALPLYTLVWRAVGSSFVNPAGVNQTFATDANNAFLAANLPHPMTYTVANIRNAAVFSTSRKVSGVLGRLWLQTV